MASKHDQQLKEITEKLEQGVKELFTSENYTDYLKTMSQFHNYSFNNTMLIAMQKPEATLVAGYQAWQTKFNRHVKRGEKAIQIIAPAPIREKQEMEKIDPITQEPVLRPDGQPETEELEVVIPRFRITSVFDVSQTEGEPLPEYATPELMGSVDDFSQFMKAIETVSPVPVRFDKIESEAKGYYDNEMKEIVIRDGMSESQTMKTAIHEVTHAKLHDRELMEELGEKKGQMTREVEAESVAYTVCQYFRLDTSDYSFPYIAGWSSSMDMKELRSSMDTIRKTAGEFIDHMTEVLQELMQNQQEKEHLEDNDLILRTSFPTIGFDTYLIVENLDKKELMVQLKTYHELYAQSNEMTVETFLEGRGARLYPWYDSASLKMEHPVNFYDVAYDYDVGVSDSVELSIMKQAEFLINREEYGKTIFSEVDRNLIVNFAFKFDNIEETRTLIKDLKEAKESGSIHEVHEVRQDVQEQIDSLPDSMIGLYELHQFGYYNEAVLPLTTKRAVELHHAGEHIYSLHKDGSRTLMNTESDILEDGGMFGIEARAWESYRIMETVRKERELESSNEMLQEPEHGREDLLFMGEENWYGIYQLDGDSGDAYRFMDYDFVREHGMEIKGADYQFLYGDVLQDQETLNSLFHKFNENRPDDFHGHSLSVSDVIVIRLDGEVKAHYVDGVGFKELPDFTRERELELGIGHGKAIEPEKKIYPPVYMHTLPYAMEHGAADDYLDSRKINLDCKEAIESAIREHFDGMYLEHNAAASVIKTYGAERVTFILANTVQQNMSDGRFSRDNKAWAESFIIPENISMGVNLNVYYAVSSHPAVLDGFIDLARTEMQEQLLEEEVRTPINEETKGLAVEGHFGTWHTEQMQEVQGEKLYLMEHDDYGNSVASIIVNADGKMVAEDLEHGFHGEAVEAIDEYFANKPITNNVQEIESEGQNDEWAYQVEDRYLFIQTTEEGFDYTYYDEDFREWDGGILDDPKLSFREALEDILEGEGFYPEQCREVDILYLQEKVQETVQTDFLKIVEMADKTTSTEQTKIPLISDRTKPEKSFNGQNPAGIEETVLCYAQAQIDDMDLTDEVELLGARVYGSRTRDGLYTENSDIDVVLSYTGKIREEDFFGRLHEDDFQIAGLPVDINPISLEKTGTLEEYMTDAEKYLDRQQMQNPTTDISDPQISFYVAECMEFPIMGEYHENLTLQEAVELYEKIPAERINGIKGIGFCLKDGSIYDGNFDLMTGGKIQKDIINDIPHYRESPLVQKAIADIRSVLSGWETIQSEQLEKEPGKRQNSADKEVAKEKLSELYKGEPEVMSKKQSVLSALRKRREKLEAKEQLKPEQTAQAHKKGEAEL